MTVAARPFTGVMATVGDHAYVPPDGLPLAVNVVFWPKHKLVSGDVTVTVAFELILRIIESTDVHPVTLSVTVTKYLVVPATGLAIVGLATVVLLRLVDGDHKYENLDDPPVAVGLAPNVTVP